MRLIDADEIRIKPDFIFYGVCGTPVIRCEDLARIINDMPTIEPQKWVSCSGRLPEEHDSIFSKFYGTEKWRDAMFRKTSKTVIITVEHRDGTRQTAPCHTIDGEWNQSMKGMGKVIAWMPLPEPWGGDSDDNH